MFEDDKKYWYSDIVIPHSLPSVQQVEYTALPKPDQMKTLFSRMQMKEILFSLPDIILIDEMIVMCHKVISYRHKTETIVLIIRGHLKRS